MTSSGHMIIFAPSPLHCLFSHSLCISSYLFLPLAIYISISRSPPSLPLSTYLSFLSPPSLSRSTSLLPVAQIFVSYICLPAGLTLAPYMCFFLLSISSYSTIVRIYYYVDCRVFRGGYLEMTHYFIGRVHDISWRSYDFSMQYFQGVEQALIR